MAIREKGFFLNFDIFALLIFCINTDDVDKFFSSYHFNLKTVSFQLKAYI